MKTGISFGTILPDGSLYIVKEPNDPKSPFIASQADASIVGQRLANKQRKPILLIPVIYPE